MPGFYMECYTGLKWVKTDFTIKPIKSLTQILNLVCQNVSKEALLTGPKIQVKIPSHCGDCVLEGQLMVTGEDLGEGQGNGEELRDIQHSMSMVLDMR